MNNELQKHLAAIGAKGGAARGKRKARTSAQARKAVQARWHKKGKAKK